MSTEPHELKHQVPEKKEVYYSFETALEMLQYLVIHGEEVKDMIIHTDNGKKYFELYNTGFQLFDERKYQEAYKVFEEALRINPVGLKARFEMVECLLQMQKNYEAVQELQALKPYVFENEIVAKYYRRNGFVYCELKEYEIAAACYLESVLYQKDDTVKNELLYIQNEAGKQFAFPQDMEKRRSLLIKNNIFISEKSIELIKKRYNERLSNNESSVPSIPSEVQPESPKRAIRKVPYQTPSTDTAEKKEEIINVAQLAAELKAKYNTTYDGNGYRVTLSSNSAIIPHYCVRCLDRLEENQIEAGQFALCSSCKKWLSAYKKERQLIVQKRMKESQKKAVWIQLIILIISIYIAIMVYYNFFPHFNEDYISAAFISAISGIAVIIGLSWIRVSTYKLGYDVHDNSKNNGFYIIRDAQQGKEIVFALRGYAELFASANHRKAIAERESFGQNDSGTTIRKSVVKVKSIRTLSILLLISAVIGWACYCNYYWPERFKVLRKPSSNTIDTNLRSTGFTFGGGSSSVNADSRLTPVSVKNGEILVQPDYKCDCPFTVKTSGSSNYYVILQYVGESKKSSSSRERLAVNKYTYESDMAFYVKGGETVSVKVPVGIYKLWYASGDTFYGTKDFFGSKTSFNVSDDLMEFYSDSSYVYGSTVTLYKVTNGNLDTRLVNRSQFPVK